MKYQQKPSVIDAERGDKLIYWFNYEPENLPTWFSDAVDAGGIVIATRVMTIETPAGRRTCTKDHMVLCTAQGEVSILRHAVFEIIYEEAGM